MQSHAQRWQDLPDNIALADEIAAFATEARETYADFILIGIGGSSLGAIATIQALTHPFRNLLPDEQRVGPRFFVLDNPDPEKVTATLDDRRPEQHAGQRRLQVGPNGRNSRQLPGRAGRPVQGAWRRAGAKADRRHHRSRRRGLLRQMADQEGYRTFPVPPGVDGRQTVLSAVGLIPAALAGVDIHALLAGARALRDRATSDDVRENPAYLLAALSVSVRPEARQVHAGDHAVCRCAVRHCRTGSASSGQRVSARSFHRRR